MAGLSILPLLSLQSHLLKVCLSLRCYGHILSLHIQCRPQRWKGNKGVQFSIQWIKLISSHLYMFPVLKINELFCPHRQASLSWKTLVSSPHSFPVKALAKEILHRQLTPHKGGLRVQLANKIKQDEPEMVLSLKQASRVWHWQRGSDRVGALLRPAKKSLTCLHKQAEQHLCFLAVWILLSHCNWKCFCYDGQRKVCGLEIDFPPETNKDRGVRTDIFIQLK